MKWGLIARAEARGLGHITWEAHRNLRPDRTLAVDMGEWARGFDPDRGRYPDAEWVRFDGRTGTLDIGDDDIVRWLSGLDVVYSAETYYDWRIVEIARALGVATVLHSMPEFHRRPECDTVDVVWLPTPWRMGHHPGSVLVPIPVAVDRFPTPTYPVRRATDPLRTLHVAGHRAALDRNGTGIVAQTFRYTRGRHHLTVRTQDEATEALQPGPHTTITFENHVTGDYWDAYTGHDVLLMPRRYGGLCLPVQEALAAGLVVVMPDVEPNRWWPIIPVAAGRGPTFEAPAGFIQTATVDPARLADILDDLAANPSTVDLYRARAFEWATANSWEALGPIWIETLDAARTAVRS